MGITTSSLVEFEKVVVNLWEDGELPFLMHLCGGNEEQLINIFKEIKSGDWVLSTHRSHYHYLLAGGSPDKLLEIIKRGKSMFVFDKEINFLTSSIVGGMATIAVGIAMSLVKTPNSVWCFCGDAAVDEGSFFEAVRYVCNNDLPCYFVVEDNDRSVNSSKVDRHGYDDIEKILEPFKYHVVYYKYNPTYPHAGSGCEKRIIFKG